MKGRIKMNKVRIFGDSCCDLPRDLREKYGIDYVKMNVVIDGEEKPASLDWDIFSPEEFYGYMRRGIRTTTTQVPTKEYIEKFTPVLEEGDDIVYIACSGVLSGSYNTSRVVAAQLKETYPEREIHCIDALNSCLGQGMLLLKAAELRDEGKSASEIADIVSDLRLNVNQFATVDSLDALKRAGRVKGSKAFFGNLFGVKPIIISDVNGQNVPVKKVKGRVASLDEIVSMMKDAITDAENQTVYVGHADCLEDCRLLAEKVKAATGCRDTYIFDIGPIIGASVGPSMIVLYAFGKKVEIVG